MELIKKCPVCNADSLIQDVGPVFTEGCYARVYRCERGHVWRVKVYFKGTKKTEIEIIEGGENN